MSKIILLTIFILFVFIEFKSLFNNKTLDINVEAQKADKTLEEYKNGTSAIMLIILILGVIIDIWAVTMLNIPILFVGTALCILLNFRAYFKLVKQLKDNKIVNKFSIIKIYHLIFDSTVLYYLVKMIFGY